MDGRPVSGASFGSAPSNTPAPPHKRNASTNKPVSKTSGPTTISLFVANLRILNLDLLADWPNISPTSFSNQDARTRIKSTEYALYQLFRAYDPATTSDKLQPFFPPLEPLQSVNLRSALFRCLNELKKNGVLAKETVLRKTMLDECSGDRFWEVCLGFSAVVVRKVTLERRVKYGRPAAERYGIAHAVGKGQRESMLPLAIAHKAALSKVLDERKTRRNTYARLQDVLIEKDCELRQRKVRASQHAKKMKQSDPSNLNAVEKAIHKSWVGSIELKDALIEGDTCAKGDGLLVQSFDKLWNAESLEYQSEGAGVEVGLLQSLSSKVNEQSARLRRWQSYHERLLAAKPASAKSSRPDSVVQKTVVKFDRHRDLNIADTPADNALPPASKHRRHDSIMKYDQILTAMREELRKNSRDHAHQPALKSAHPPQIHSLKRAQTTPIPPRRPSLNVNTISGAQDPHLRSPSQTAVPFFPKMGRRVSSQSRSYEKPKVESQREPIPLKAELFSPLKDKRSSDSPGSCVVTLPSPAEEEGERSVAAEQAGDVVTEDVTPEAEGSRCVSAGPRSDVQALGLSECGNTTAVHSSPTAHKNNNVPSSASAQLMSPALPVKAQELASQATRPSLAERTRMSIAFNSSDNVISLPSDLSDEALAATEVLDELPILEEEETQPSFDRRTTLLERTRQSMGPMEAVAQTKKSSHHRSRTSVYPVNQFDTPKKNRRSTIGIKEGGKRDITPLDQLWSPDAECSSVFKSRPKIALSPVLSPRADTDMNGILEGDVGRSSPLVDVGGRG